jgi:hypothetical protein
VNLLGDNIETVKRNAETLIDASEEVDLEVYRENKDNVGVSSLEYG